MKYEVGDKVILGIGKDFVDAAVKDVDDLPERIATIKTILKGKNKDGSPNFSFLFEEFSWAWEEKYIECLASEFETIERWHLLDFD